MSNQKIIIRADTRLITQPTPRNIGRRNTHNTNTIIEPMKITNTLTTFFIWLKPEVEVLPRLFDMLLFVIIVRHFFCISTIGFSLLDTQRTCEATEGCSPFGLKIRVQNEYSPELAEANTLFCVWRFLPRVSLGELKVQSKGKRISRATHVCPSEQIEICLLILQ